MFSDVSCRTWRPAPQLPLFSRKQSLPDALGGQVLGRT